MLSLHDVSEWAALCWRNNQPLHLYGLKEQRLISHSFCMLVFVRVLRGNRTNNMHKYLLWGIDSHTYEGWEVQWSTLCSLETQESWWCNWVWIWRRENQGSLWYKSQSEERRRWNEMSQLSVRQEKGSNIFSLCFCPIQTLNGLNNAYYIGEGNLLCWVYQSKC